MGFVTGLVSQLGAGVETTAGTAVTVATFQPHVSATGKLDINRAQGEGLYGSTNGVALASRHVTTTRTVTGDFEVELTDIGLGKFWRWALGSTTTPAVLSGSAYEAVFKPGDQLSAGSSMTLQVGRPQTDGTVKPFTWNGAKCTGFEFGGNVTDPLNAKFSFDAWNETTATALATASYSTTQQQFTGAQLSVSIGGSASTSGGKTTVSGGSALSGVLGATVKGENPLNTDRFYAGSSGVKSEQQVNGYRKFTVDLDMHFVSQSAIYDLYTANTTTELVLTWAMPTAITGSYYPSLEVVIPAAKITSADVDLDGADFTSQKVTFEALYDGTNNPFQIRTISTDTSL